MKRDLDHPFAHALSPSMAQAAGTPATADLSAGDNDEMHRLMHGVAQGSRDSFRLLYERTHGRLLTIALRLVRNRAAAEDVVQETFIRVWRYSRSYKPEHGAPMAWIAQMLRNRAIDMRAFGRQEEVPFAEEEVDASHTDADDAEDWVGDVAPQAAPRAGVRVADSFTKLSGPYRQVLHLAHHEGLSHSEIAQRLGVPLGTAKTWLRRALIALRVALECEAAQNNRSSSATAPAPTEMTK